MDRLYLTAFTVPAATPQSALAQVIVPLEDALLKRIVIVVPDGHVGLTGLRIVQSNQQIIPWSNFQFLVANNRTITVEYDDEITISGLKMQGFNLDVFDHTFYIESTIVDIPLKGSTANAAQSGASIVPFTDQSQLDPLSPTALLASIES